MLGDPVRVRQVLGNLVSNAIKFTESGAVLLAVTAAPANDGKQQLEFSVNDTGVGVAADEQARIFEAFEQADDSTTRKFGGTGLGLAISRQLVELMHGSIGLESEPGRGSRFFFRLPVGTSPVATAAPSPANDLGIILVGMHSMVARVVGESLAAESAQVIAVDSPGSAIEALGELTSGVRRVRVIVDAGATSRLREAVDGMRIAAAPRSVEIVVLVPPNSDGVPTAGVNRCIIKPLLTHDLLSAPAPARTPADTAPAVSREAVARGSRGRALLVEDNAVNQEMTRAMLEVLGFDVTIASNGREGVAAVTADPELDVILMDCQMPVMDGLAAARAVRALEAGDRRVPILALTGNARPDDIQACLSAGMDDCLVKPFSLTALRSLLDRWAAASIVSGSAIHSTPASR
jgi:CheY-like chemotaxis protein